MLRFAFGLKNWPGRYVSSYCSFSKVVLSSDPKRSSTFREKAPSDVSKQLDAVQAHIEDLQVMTGNLNNE
jgi:hypothetical protein